jgi:hypothetical protein
VLDRIITFAGKFAILLGVVALALYLTATFVFSAINASDHLSGLGPREWFLFAFIFSVMLVVGQKLAAWVTA